MIKLVCCIRKKCEVSSEEFLDRWRRSHALIGSRIPGVLKHVQNYVVIDGNAAEHSFDGIIELWFESLESLLQAQQSAEWKRMQADQKEFTEHGIGSFFLCEEYEIKPH